MKAFVRKIYFLGIVLALIAGLNTLVGLTQLEAPWRREQGRRAEAELQYLVGEISAKLSYVEKTLGTVGSYLTMESDEDKIYQFLGGILEQNPDYLAIYLGTPENRLTYVDGWIPPPDFNVSSRPWYRTAVREGQLIYTEPYLDAVEDRWVITVANPIYGANEELLGVVGLDQSLGSMLDFLQDQSFIFSNSGELIVGPPEFEQEGLANICGIIDCSLIDGSPQGVAATYFTNSNGYLYWQTLAESGFIVATFMPESDILNSRFRNQLVFDTVIFTFIVGLVVLLFFLRTQIILPMRELERDILSTSLIEDVNYRLPVSRKSRLSGLRESLNEMLQKIQERFEQILLQREELAAAYSKLIVHEQELQEQYTQIKKQQEQIRQMAEIDSLTGLYNRRRFQTDLTTFLENGEEGAVFMLDIDDFKYINDTQGHTYGDRVLWSVARFLEQKLPKEAIAYRFGGDEFLIVVRREIDQSKIRSYVDEVSQLLEVLLPVQGTHNHITCSMGVVRYPQDGTTVDELLVKADIALHHAKRLGKNRHQFFKWDIAAIFSERMQLEEVVVEAISAEALTLLYQPIIETKTGQIAYFEALVRLEGRSVSPADFVPIAEELDLTIPLGRWVIQEAINQLARIQNTRKPAKPISVNLSVKQFYDEGLVDFLTVKLAEQEVDASLLELEITEEVLFNDPEEALQVIEQLKSIGVTMALDDYGTGYSSIDYLAKIQVDRMKLHESLTEKFWDYMPVMEGLISIAHGLGMTVVAEGVEKLEEAHFFSRVKCDYLQGYLFSKPVSAAQAEEMLDQNYCHLLGVKNGQDKKEN